MTESEPLFIDSNVPMYVAGREHPYRAPCMQILTRIAAGQLAAITSSEVHQEILHRFLALGLRPEARQVSADFQVAVPNVLPVTIDDVGRARELSDKYPSLPARDLIHVAVMLTNGITAIVSADRHFDRVSEVRRLDPLTLAASLPA